MMEHMSKYAKKVAARREAAEKSNRACAAIALAVRISEGTARMKLPPQKKPKQPPPPPRSQINDLGALPRLLAGVLAEAVVKIREAEGLLEEMQKRANPGRQAAEPLAIAQFLVATRPRFVGMMERAEKIPNQPQPEAGRSE